jgi:hypothetical protein
MSGVGKLSFKGDKPKKKKREREAPEEANDDEDLEALAQESNEPLPGEGKLTSSGVVVMGHDSNFTAQLAVGDSLLVTVSDKFRNTQEEETRVVNMVLGRTSLNLEAPFSCDLTAPTAFLVLKRAPDIEALKAARSAAARRNLLRLASAAARSQRIDLSPAAPCASARRCRGEGTAEAAGEGGVDGHLQGERTHTHRR